MGEDDSIREFHDTDGIAYDASTVTQEIAGDPDTVSCTMNEAEVEKRRRWVRSELLPHLDDVEEHPHGFTLVFDGTDEALGAVMKFAHLESRCCSHATFEIEIPPGTDPVRLGYYGSREAVELAHEGFISRIPDEVLS